MQYGINDVAENGAVKPSFGLVLLSLFLCRQLIYAPLGLLAGRTRGGLRKSDLDLSFLQATSIFEFVACIPGALLVFLIFKNKEKIGDRLKAVWLKGKLVLSAGLLAQIAAQIYYYIATGNQPSAVGLVLAVTYLYTAMYIYTNQRLKDTFSRVPF